MKVQENILKFIELYNSGVSNIEIGKLFGIKPNTVCYWASKLGLKMKGSGKHNYYANPFIKQSPERDYWLGYLFADGHIESGLIELVSILEEVVLQFNAFTGNICKIKCEKYTVSDGSIHYLYRAKIYSKEIAEWFINTFNVDSTKHHNLNPDINLNWNILRGYFDGDGSAHKKGGFTINSSSKVWINRIAKFLKRVKVTAKINKWKDCYKLCVWKKSDLITVVNKLYYNSTFCIKYKKERFEPFFSNEDRSSDELLGSCDANQQPS